MGASLDGIPLSLGTSSENKPVDTTFPRDVSDTFVKIIHVIKSMEDRFFYRNNITPVFRDGRAAEFVCVSGNNVEIDQMALYKDFQSGYNGAAENLIEDVLVSVISHKGEIESKIINLKNMRDNVSYDNERVQYSKLITIYETTLKSLNKFYDTLVTITVKINTEKLLCVYSDSYEEYIRMFNADGSRYVAMLVSMIPQIKYARLQ